MKRSLSGIKPTGSPHLGNYLGMIRPAIDLQKNYDTAYFVADYHALNILRDPKQLREDTRELAAIFLACGYDAELGILYRQSDVPEVTELTYILSNAISMGDLFRAHAYKAAKDKGEDGRLLAGVFIYPILMAADILIHDSDVVPVGQDQIQHCEMARAMAQRFNHLYKSEALKEPKELVQENVATIIGTDGQKMSKSYNNGINPFASEKQLKKQVMNIVTDSKELEDKKNPDNCHIVSLYRLLADSKKIGEMENAYRAGNYGYGHAKKALLESILEHFAPYRKRFEEIKEDKSYLESVLEEGAARARERASAVIHRVRAACGLGPG